MGLIPGAGGMASIPRRIGRQRACYMALSGRDIDVPKPLLEKYDGQKFPGEIKYDNAAQASAKVMASPFLG